MEEILNMFQSAGYKFMPEMNLRHPGFTYSDSGTFTFNKKPQKIQDIFIKSNQTKPAFNTIWLTEILKIYLEQQLLIK